MVLFQNKANLEFNLNKTKQKPTCDDEFWVLDITWKLETAEKLQWDPGSVCWKANSSNLSLSPAVERTIQNVTN